MPELTQVDTVPWKSDNENGLAILVMARKRDLKLYTHSIDIPCVLFKDELQSLAYLMR